MSQVASLFRRGNHEPPPSLWQRVGWIGVSVAFHLIVFAVLLSLSTEIPRVSQVAFIPLELGPPETADVPFPLPSPNSQRQPPPLPGTRRPVAGQGARALPRPEVVEEQRRGAPAEPPPEPVVQPRDTLRVAAGRSVRTHRLLKPGYGDGRLWVPPIDVLELGRPLPAAPVAGGIGAPGGEAGPTVAQLDSTISARLRAFLDTLPSDSFAPPGTPRWTTEINGRTWGVDGKWIYLGGIKLPAALLALLPFPQGNIDQSRAANQLMLMREDIMQAARRAQTTDEFRKYVKELRTRMEEERAARKREGRDTVIP